MHPLVAVLPQAFWLHESHEIVAEKNAVEVAPSDPLQQLILLGDKQHSTRLE